MAVRKKPKASTKKKEKKESVPSISVEQKKKISAIFLFVISLLLFLSIATFSRNETLSTFFNDLVNGVSTHNWLGIVGAYLSAFFVESLLGYFSVIFPVILFLSGLLLYNKITLKKLLVISNYGFLFSFIITGFFGILRHNNYLLQPFFELSGGLGLAIGKWLSVLLGGIGALIFTSMIFVVALILAFDVKVEKIYHFLKGLFSASADKLKEEYSKGDISETEKENLKKIKDIRKSKKDKDTPGLTAEDLKQQEAAAAPQTNISIVRKDEPKIEIAKKEPVKKQDQKVEPKPEKTKKEIEEEEGAPISPIANNRPNPWEELAYNMPTMDLLEAPAPEDFKVAEEELKRNAELLTDKLKRFDIDIKDITVTPGPVVTLYEIVPAEGVKISKIVSLEHDIALALAARGIRIIAPIPGKSAIGVEIPNAIASMVNASSVLGAISSAGAELPIALGKQINGEIYVADLAKMPHLLIAGSTGSGKSVGINMIITSLLYAKHPSEIKFIMVDPKKIELSFYNALRFHYLAASVDIDEEIITNPQNAVLVLKAVELEMEKRYDKLAKAGVRNIVDYNKKIKDPVKRPKDTDEIKHHNMPYIVVIIDELADLMITAGKEVEEPITRLAQLARAVGIHLVLATQRPSVNVITGVIKANFSARIAYQVATKIDSRTILDMNGAEQLLGRGDMLFLPTGSPKPIRMQNAFITTDEVERITEKVKAQLGYNGPYPLPSIMDKSKNFHEMLADLDPMFEDAARIIVQHQQGSVSLLQRRLKLGYSRAARIVDQLELAGVVGPSDGSKAREVRIETLEELETIIRNL